MTAAEQSASFKASGAPEYITVTQAVALTGLPRKRVDEMFYHHRLLPFVKREKRASSKRFVHRDDFAKFLAEVWGK